MPRSSGRSWTPETTARLFDMTRNGLTQKHVARILRRSPKAIERKVAKIRKQIATLPFSRLAPLLNKWEMAQLITGKQITFVR